MKYRVKFGKYGVMKFVGHLDIMRYFQKAIRRADLPIKYSEGFNPHQIMSFAAPLGVGITSDGEYMDVEMRESISSKVAVRKLEEAMVDGMHIFEFRALPDEAEKAMAAVKSASYYIYYRESLQNLDEEDLVQRKNQFYDQATTISVMKKTKKSEREIDLKPLIFDFRWEMLPESLQEFSAYKNGFYLHVSTGSTDNIKPEFVMETFHQMYGMEAASFGIHRIDLYTNTEQGCVSLGDVGYDYE